MSPLWAFAPYGACLAGIATSCRSSMT